ncbi:MAG TPA: hypothetical protein VFD59_12875 [Nocardioidaceae bacterium]|nr:hypothetical protein [Nocardioidaceae bacterium]
MKKFLLVLLGSVMTLVGALWTMQGLGYLAGSAMTDVSMWAVVGPIVGGLGVALLYVALRGAVASRRD